MNCYKHTEKEAVGACTGCGKLVCEDCAVEINGKILCKECAASLASKPMVQNVQRKPIKKASKQEAMSIRAVSAVLLIYSIYCLFSISKSSMNSITGGRLPKTIPPTVTFGIIVLLAYIIYSITKLIKTETTFIPAIILLIIDGINNIQINSTISKLYTKYQIRIPFKFYVDWYFPLILLLILIVLTSSIKGENNQQ